MGRSAVMFLSVVAIAVTSHRCTIAQAPVVQDRFQRGPETGERSPRPGGHRVDPQSTQQLSKAGVEEGVPADGRRSAEPLTVPRREPGLRVRPPQVRLGVYAYNTPTGVVVTRVVPGSPASNEGLERGDRIVAVGGYQVGIVGDWVYYLGEELQRQVRPDGMVQLLVQNVRNNQLLSMEVDLIGRRPFGPTGNRPQRNRPRFQNRPD